MRYLLLFLLFLSCNTPPKSVNFLEGDILFQDLDCGAACDAIEAVTEGVDGWDFSHCGIVVMVSGKLKVMEAYGSVKLVDLDTFLQRSVDRAGRPKVLVGRPKNHQLAVKTARFHEPYIGKEYDEAFTLGDDKYYCSELVYECFKSANYDKEYFPLNVMTFKQPGTDSFMPFWVEYYKELGVPIPEGEQGINPGAISRSKNLVVIGQPK
ncbi:MAG: hypothetical protein H6551_01910 [Chitinophagales bacterium]|nr:hypothetical protein [Chitinophagaceae bacterium]MCB9063878.1 hypothetical protein [Chitinophagales bacterium]